MHTRIVYLFLTVAILLFCTGAITTGASANPAYPEMMIVLDGSGSMWGKIGDDVKIEAARSVLREIIPGIPKEVNVGLASYGHNRKGDCNDIEILLPPGSTDRDQLLQKALAISPKGKTPIADTLLRVTELLKSKEGETTVVLISDGEETCHDTPCEAVAAMKKSGIKFVLHVVGFGVNESQKSELNCLAEAGGGSYFSADSAAALLASFEQVQKHVEQKVEKAESSRKKASTGLGKLHITIPKKGLISLNSLTIVRTRDDKPLKKITSPSADSLHPLPAGEYRIVAGFKNPNYADDSEASFGSWTVAGGETTEAGFGVLTVNISDELAKMVAGAVILSRNDDPEFNLAVIYKDNDYYLYKPKPLPPGTYTLSYHYKRSYLYRTPDTPVALATGLEIVAGGEAVAAIDSGIQLVKPQSGGVSAFELVSDDSSWGTMKIESASNGDFPLWKVYGVPPGTYSLNLFMEGMDEPLPVAEGLSIGAGELIEFDTGL